MSAVANKLVLCLFQMHYFVAGKATGLVTTTRITHATPAALYAHSADRYWESDYGMIKQEWKGGEGWKYVGECEDIAHQFVHEETAKNFKVSPRLMSCS
jgi:alkaline phosphatase